ncbi:MAG: signal recognition particle-docking protein FtsY [Chromatiales bacterium]|nr:signal recognition particle-docking protein FtsY [Chromatiales bacterium]
MKWHTKLREKLQSSRGYLTSGLSALFKAQPDERLLDELERRFLMTDVGMAAAKEIIAKVKVRTQREGIQTLERLLSAVEEEIVTILKSCESTIDLPQRDKPYVVLMIGVNGSGKTTTAAKLAYHYKQQGKSVMLAAADTFRAAATEQLQMWASRCGLPCIAQPPGADSAAIVYDAMASAEAKGIDMVIADTAGRLHTDKNLLDELRKIKRVAAKQNAAAPDETILVIDGTTGQNAQRQVAEFHKALGIDGLIVTKLDGTAKGGILVAVAQATAIPIRFIGVGEALEDLQVFNAKAYAAAMLQT